MANFFIREMTWSDDPQIAAMINSLNPDWPPLAVETLRFGRKAYPSDAHRTSFVAEQNGAVVGDCLSLRQTHVEDEHTYWFTVRVRPQMWRQGIGSCLYDRILPTIKGHGARRLYCSYREDQPHAESFLVRRGFVPSGSVLRESRLEVRRATLDRARERAARLTQQGIRITTLAELSPLDETILRSIHQMENDVARDIPTTQAWSGEPFNEWRQRYIENPTSGPERLWLALEGEHIVGIARLEREASENGLTAVDRSYRGRGIAQALKYHQVTWAVRNDVEFIVTGNHDGNAPMLAVNRALGYQPTTDRIEMVMEFSAETGQRGMSPARPT